MLNNKYFRIIARLQIVDNSKIRGVDPEYFKIIPIRLVACNPDYFTGLYERNQSSSTFSDIKANIINDYNCLDFGENGVHLLDSSFAAIYSKNIRLHLEFDYLNFIKDFNLTYTQLFTRYIFPLQIQGFYQTYSYDPQDKPIPFKKELGYVDFPSSISSANYINAQYTIAESIQDDGYLFSSHTQNVLQGLTSFNLMSLPKRC